MNKIAKCFMFSVVFPLLLVSGCGLKPISAKNLSPSLQKLYVQTANPYSDFSTTLHRTFAAYGIQIVKNRDQAPVTLNIISNASSHSTPSILNSNLPTTITYSYTINFRLETADKKPITATQTLSSSQSQLINALQIYSTTSNNTITESLQRETIILLYYSLGSTTTRTAVQQALTGHGKK